MLCIFCINSLITFRMTHVYHYTLYLYQFMLTILYLWVYTNQMQFLLILYIGPPYLELKFKMLQDKQVGSKVEVECLPTDGNPNGISSEYNYLLCFKPILATNNGNKNFHLSECSDECCRLYSNKKVTTKLEFFHRGNYWCSVEHESKDPKMERNSKVQQLDVECTSSNGREFYYVYFT